MTHNKATKYLITGGAGFIGSHLARALLDEGHRVSVIDDLSTGSRDNIQHLIGHPDFHFARASITDEIVLDRLAAESDVIFHLAAAVGVRLIVERPVHTIETNVMGTEAVLKAAIRYGAKVVLTSTSEVYGKGNGVPFGEEDDVVLGSTYRSRWAYAATKMVDEFLALAYYREKGLPVVVVRLFNTVGPRQTGEYGMVVPRFIKQALAGQPLLVHGDGKQSRCFVHVRDAVDAILELSRCPKAVGQVCNIGSTEEITILELAHVILERVDAWRNQNSFPNSGDPALACPEPARIELMPYEKAYGADFEDMRQRVPNIGKVRELVGWQPKASLRQIVDDMIAHMAPTQL